MVIIRLLTLKGLTGNFRVFAKWVRGKDNGLSDALSQMKFESFWKLVKQKGKNMEKLPTPLPVEMWPPTKLWIS